MDSGFEEHHGLVAVFVTMTMWSVVSTTYKHIINDQTKHASEYSDTVKMKRPEAESCHDNAQEAFLTTTSMMTTVRGKADMLLVARSRHHALNPKP